MRPEPRFNQVWRFIGPGRGHGTIHRILRCTWKEIGTVQDSVQPDWSWLGSVEDFLKNFVIANDAGSYGGRNKNGGINLFGW